jgi:hypothetical protein
MTTPSDKVPAVSDDELCAGLEKALHPSPPQRPVPDSLNARVELELIKTEAAGATHDLPEDVLPGAESSSATSEQNNGQQPRKTSSNAELEDERYIAPETRRKLDNPPPPVRDSGMNG